MSDKAWWIVAFLGAVMLCGPLVAFWVREKRKERRFKHAPLIVLMLMCGVFAQAEEVKSSTMNWVNPAASSATAAVPTPPSAPAAPQQTVLTVTYQQMSMTRGHYVVDVAPGIQLLLDGKSLEGCINQNAAQNRVCQFGMPAQTFLAKHVGKDTYVGQATLQAR